MCYGMFCVSVCVYLHGARLANEGYLGTITWHERLQIYTQSVQKTHAHMYAIQDETLEGVQQVILVIDKCENMASFHIIISAIRNIWINLVEDKEQFFFFFSQLKCFHLSLLPVRILANSLNRGSRSGTSLLIHVHRVSEQSKRSWPFSQNSHQSNAGVQMVLSFRVNVHWHPIKLKKTPETEQ